MTLHISDLSLALALVALIVAVTVALRYRATAARRAEHIDALETQVRMRDEETRHLAEQRLPALAAGLWQGAFDEVPPALHPGLAGSPFAQDQEAVLAVFREASRISEQAAQGMLLAVARKLQGLANGQQVKITEMQHRHDDPLFLEDLMEVDHTNAQILRRAAGIAVVCRAWPGRQHNATPLHEVVRGAIGRIMDYRRVEIVRIEDTRAVLGRAVEPVVVTLAELLENATRLSHPNTPVQVHVQLTHTGVAFVIEDAGVGLNAAEREKALRLLNDDSLSLAGLGNPPRFGLAACGALARRYGFSVSVDAGSAFGGVRAVVSIPKQLLTDAAFPRFAPAEVPGRPERARVETHARADSWDQARAAANHPAPQAGTAERTAVAERAGTPERTGAPERTGTTANGLPKRTRQAPAEAQDPAAGTEPDGQAPAAPPAAHRPPGQAAAPLSAFQRASQAAAHHHRPS
jgi:hypothetical protein